METEKQFKEIFGKMSHDQLLDYAYKLCTEVETLQEKNSSLKRAMYGRKKENVNIDQLSLFNEAELIDESSKPDEVKDVDIPEDTASARKRGKNKNLKTIREKVIDITMDNPVCDICGGKIVERFYGIIVLGNRFMMKTRKKPWNRIQREKLALKIAAPSSYR